MKRRYALALAVLFCLPVLDAGEYKFTIPMNALQVWSKDVVVTVSAELTGHSGVHLVSKDCEMHFGGTVDGYSGTPAGWVFEPMNVCIQPYFKQKKQKKADWIAFGERVVAQGTVEITGVPRIWPEHLSGQEHDSNPNHTMEIHPITTLMDGNTKRDFTSFIFAPSGLAGISEETQQAILETTTVEAHQSGGSVNVTMETHGFIGNFADIDVSIDPSTIKLLGAGHIMEGEAEIEGGGSFPVHMVSVAGTAIDQRITKAMQAKKDVHLEVLALFSLSPSALLEAAQAGSS